MLLSRPMRAANFNGISFNDAFVRQRAQRMLSDG